MRSTNRGLPLAFILLSLASSAAAATPEKPKFPDTYVGSETCQACHEDTFNAIVKSPHGAVEKRDGHACESCHGPGAKHAGSADAADIRNPLKMRASAVDETCLSCHRNQETHVGRISNGHSKQGVSCISCHKVHADGGHSLVARSTETVNPLCASCHRDVWASFQKPFGHRLPQGAMNCVDCHNPHGTIRKAMQQTFAANEPGCFRCHGDKRGPFTFEHAPVRFEGCGTCHQPHGSSNPRMLVRHEARLICLECHANLPAPNAKNAAMGIVPPSFHDLRSPRYQNCTVCHQKVHGSYTDRNLIR
jgi:DmsE family decaheme c-type cytochrome